MDKNDFKVASISEMKLMLDWAKREGWNPGLMDHIPFQVADPRGFLVGYYQNLPLACISVVKYADNFAFLGMYIVKPEYRGQGFGFKLWQKGMKYVKGYNIGLDGVIEQQDNYKKSGFTFAHRNIRFAGLVSPVPVDGLVDGKFVPFDILLDYDRRFFPAARPAFLAAWLSMDNCQSFAVYDQQILTGYGVIRKCHSGYKIGPLFADNAEIAEKLFLGLCAGLQSQQVFLDVPEPNPAALALAEAYHLKPVFETARMYTHFVPTIDLNKVFGITSFELG